MPAMPLPRLHSCEEEETQSFMVIMVHVVAPIALLIVNNSIFYVRLNVQSILYINSLLPFGERLKCSLSGLILRVLSHAPIALLFIRV